MKKGNMARYSYLWVICILLGFFQNISFVCITLIKKHSVLTLQNKVETYSVPLWKTFWQFLTKLNTLLSCNPGITFLGNSLNELKSTSTQKPQ